MAPVPTIKLFVPKFGRVVLVDADKEQYMRDTFFATRRGEPMRTITGELVDKPAHFVGNNAPASSAVVGTIVNANDAHGALEPAKDGEENITVTAENQTGADQLSDTKLDPNALTGTGDVAKLAEPLKPLPTSAELAKTLNEVTTPKNKKNTP